MKLPSALSALVLWASVLLLAPLPAGSQGKGIDDHGWWGRQNLTKAEQNWLREHPTLRLGVGTHFMPIMFVEKENGAHRFKGMVSDYVAILEKRLGVRMEVVFGITFPEALDLGRAGKIDLFPCVAETPDRSDFLIYTKPYLSFPLVIITRKDYPSVSGLNDLNGKKLAEVKALATYGKLKRDYPRIGFHFVNTIPEELEAVCLGKADACVVNLAVASYYMEGLGLVNLKVAGPTEYKDNNLRMGVRQDWPMLVGILDKALASISRAEREEIQRSWVHISDQYGLAPSLVLKWGLGIGGAILLVLLSFLYWNRKLQREIGERKRTEEALRDSQEQYQLMFDNAPVGYQSLDKKGCILDVNQVWLDRLGYQRDEVIGRWFGDFLHDDQKEVFRKFFPVNIQSTEPIFGVEFDLKRKDDSHILVEYTARIGRDAEGGFVRTHCVFQDITERKRVEKDLRESENKFSLAFQTSPYAITITRADDGSFLEVNEAFTAISGYTRQEALANSSIGLSLWVNEEDRQSVVEDLRTGLPVTGREYQFKSKSGGIITGLFSAQPLVLGDGPCLLSSINDISERKRAEEELRDSRERAIAILYANPDPMVVYDDQGLTQFVNPAFTKVFGWSLEELRGRRIPFMPDDQAETSLAKIMELYKSSGPVSFESKRLTRSGQLLDVFIQGAPIRGQDDTAIGMVGNIRDITEAKKIREALQKSETRYRAIFENISDLVCTHDLEGRITSINPVALESFGYTVDEGLGAKLPNLIPEKLRKIFYEGYLKIIQEEGHAEGIMQIQTKDGQVHFLEYRNTLIRPEGEEPYITGVARDITERLKADAALRESEEQFHTAFEGAPEGMALIDLEQKYVMVNPRLCEMLGYEKEELRGRSFNEFTHPDDRETSAERWGEIMKSGAQVMRAEKRYIHKSGKVIWGKISSSALRDSNGEINYVLTHINDITEIKEAEEGRAALESQLRQAQKMEAVGTLAGGIAHDFNNILAAIMGYAEIALEDSERGDTSPTELKGILQASERAKGLIQQILTFSRKANYELRLMNINEQLISAFNLLQQTIPKMIKIQLNLSDNIPPVLADPYQIEQIMMNLGTNARDAMPDGGTLTISTSVKSVDGLICRVCSEPFSGDFVVITVTDSGMGIKGEELEKIFDPFFTTKEVGQGTGLGLSTVFGVVSNHRGHLTCSSKPGEGTTFNIYLSPVEGQVESGGRDEAPHQEAIEGGNETILLVDDEAHILDIGFQSLSRAGYRVLTAADGEKALELFGSEGHKIDLVILDLSMPGMGGHSCLKGLLNQAPGLKVIIATGYSRDGDISETISTGAAAILIKPFRRDDLLKTVRLVLDA